MNIKCRDPFIGRDSKDIHILWIDVGGGWRTGCGSHPQSAERVEELEESVWSVVRQENEREDQGEGVQNRPALMYGAATWALKKAQEKKLEVAEMRMLRWMCGVTKVDKIINERIRGTTKVGEITKKVQERRLKWYGHVMRREEHYVGRRAMVMKVQGRRKRGRPKRRWLDKVKDDIKEKGLSADAVYDRATWRRMSSYIDPT